MKNLSLSILGVFTLVFALTLNFKHALDDYGILNNSLHLEVLAQSNSSGHSSNGGSSSGGGSSFNPPQSWWGQGLTKDERELSRPCPNSSSGSVSGGASGGNSAGHGGISGGASSSQSNPSTRNDISCPYGDNNCTPIAC